MMFGVSLTGGKRQKDFDLLRSEEEIRKVWRQRLRMLL